MTVLVAIIIIIKLNFQALATLDIVAQLNCRPIKCVRLEVLLLFSRRNSLASAFVLSKTANKVMKL